MSKYAKQHHVAVHILNNFRSQLGKFYYYNKGRVQKGVVHRNTEKVFYKRHQYSLENGTGVKQVEIESIFFKKLDNDIKPIIDKICLSVDAGHYPGLSNEEKAFWDYYFLTQHFRSPEVLNSEDTKNLSKQNYTDVINEVREEVRRRWPAEYHLLDDPEFIRRSIKNAPIHSLLSDREMPLKALAKRGLMFGRVMPSNKTLIIGSRPIMRYNSDGTNHLADPRTELWFPLSSKVMVSPGSVSQKEMLIGLNRDIVRRHNEFIFKQSDEVGSESKALLLSLINPR